MNSTYRTIEKQINTKINSALEMLQVLNSYMYSRSNLEQLEKNGVLDPTCLVDLMNEFKTLNKYVHLQSKKLDSMTIHLGIVACRYICSLDDIDLEDLVMECQKAGMDININDFLQKAKAKDFSEEEYTLIIPVLCKWKN